MPLKIIGAGYGRTGTLSMKTALNQLGFNCYHMEEVMNGKKNKAHLDFWVKVAESKPGVQHNWEEVFGNYSATVDNPGCCVYKELYEAYPEAKVILTLHPKGPEAWYKSTINTIYFSEQAWEAKILVLFIPFFRKMRRMVHRLIWQRSHQGTMSNKEAAMQRYNAHIEEVKAAIHKDNLLIFSVDQGWQPLCHFLGVEIPSQDFPRKNDTKEFQKKIMAFKGMAYTIIIIITAILLFFIIT